MRGRAVARVSVVLLSMAVLAGCHLIEPSTNRTVTRVVVVGDSVMAWTAPYLERLYAPYATVEYVGALSTGPLSSQKLWAKQLRDELAANPADVVIFEACCHYEGSINGQPGPLFVNANGVTVQPDSELMYQELATADAELVQIARSAGASPYWVRLPPPTAATAFYGPTFPTRVNRFNAITGTLGVPVIDWGAAVMSQPNVNDLRNGDGVHYTGPGYQFVANVTFAATVVVVP